MRSLLACCLVLLTAACGSGSSSPPPAGSATAPPSVAAAPARASTDARAPAPSTTWPPRTASGAAPETLHLAIADPYVDPLAAVSRGTLSVNPLDPHGRVLAESDEVFRAQWGGTIPGAVHMRSADLPERRRALLFLPDDDHPARATPFLVVADARHRVLWQKARPLPGNEGTWRHLTVTAGPEGSVLVFWWDPVSRAVSARRWRHGGELAGDHHVLDVDDCAGLDAVWWPGHGWIVTTVARGVARTTLLGEDGGRRFGKAFLDLGGGPREVDTGLQVAAGADGVFYAFAARARSAAGAPRAPWHLMVTFRREDGTAPWGRDLDLGSLELQGPEDEGVLGDVNDAVQDAGPRDPRRPRTHRAGIRIELVTPIVLRIDALEPHLVGSDGTLEPESRAWPR